MSWMELVLVAPTNSFVLHTTCYKFYLLSLLTLKVSNGQLVSKNEEICDLLDFICFGLNNDIINKNRILNTAISRTMQEKT